MTELNEVIAGRHGVVRARDLIQAGLSRQDIRDLQDDAKLVRLRHGWYAEPWAADQQARDAVAAGGVLTCVSALAKRGIWTPGDSRLHLRRSEHRIATTSAPKSDRWLGKHWLDEPTPRSVDTISSALRAAARCVRGAELVAICDSVLATTDVDRDDVLGLVADAPSSVRQVVALCDGRAESGTESLTRFRLAARQISTRPQVATSGVGRVDLLVGSRLVIECDSKAHHTAEEAYRTDRRRDRALVRLGYLVVRLTYEEVMFEWEQAERDILAVVRRGDHLRIPAARAKPRGRYFAKPPNSSDG